MIWKNLRLVLPALLLLNVAYGQSYNPLTIPPVLSGTSFNLSFNTGTMQFFPGLTTDTYGINGNYLGPTLILQKGDSVSLDVTNNLPEVTSCHWHGLHVPSRYDGGPHTTIDPGVTWNAHFKVMNDAGTYWYHPHVHMNTMPQANKGLAGMIIIKDSVEDQLLLPRTYGTDDFPVILQDKKYSQSGQLNPNALGDSMQVNGTIHPYLDIPKQVVRLRLLNGSNARVYNIGFSDQRNFYVIGGDGGLLDEPYLTNRILLSNGERLELLLDLTGDTIGTSFFLQSFASEMATNIPGAITGMMGGNGPLEAVDFPILKMNVIPATPNAVVTIPATLVTHTPWSISSASRTRNRTVSGMGMVSGQGNFFLDNTQYDHMVINDTMILGDIEVWNITNTSNMAHPMHIHDIQFYILSRNGIAPAAYETGPKDVVLVRPNETVSLITRFEDFADDTIPYMYHCHNLAHEDMGMMLQFIVTSPTSGVSSEVKEKYNVYPNPSSVYWKIETLNAKINKAEMFDVTGSEIKTDIIINNGNIYIGNGNLPSGIYIVKISSNKEITSYRLIKE